MFKPLNKSEIREIVGLQIKGIDKMLHQNDINLTVTEKAIDLIADAGFDPQFGARPIKRVIQREVLNELSKMILAGKVNRAHKIVLDAEGNKLIFRNK